MRGYRAIILIQEGKLEKPLIVEGKQLTKTNKSPKALIGGSTSQRVTKWMAEDHIER